MVKIQSDPQTYVVSQGGILHHVPTEEKARDLYGPLWNTLIDDIDPTFFINYTLGDPLSPTLLYNTVDEMLQGRIE